LNKFPMWISGNHIVAGAVAGVEYAGIQIMTPYAVMQVQVLPATATFI
jgi:hypothetical protein